MIKPIPGQTLIEYAKAGASGFRVGEKGDVVPSLGIGEPLRLGEACFCVRAGKEWHLGDLARAVMPFKMPSRGSLFPFMGDLHIEGRALTESEITALGISGAGMPGSNAQPVPVAYPVICYGGRGILIPCAMKIPVKRSDSQGYVFAGELLASCKTPEDSKAAFEKGLRFIHAIGFQFSGVGIQRYVYHSALKRAGRVDLAPTEVILGEDQIFEKQPIAIVQRQDYAGKSGIFLDQRHQPAGPDPSGASRTGPQSVERDAKLWAQGAHMSGVTLTYLPLLSKEELDHALAGC
jgi:hypothetical protein